MKYLIMWIVWVMFGWVFTAEYAHGKAGAGISFGTDYTELRLVNTMSQGYSGLSLFELSDEDYSMYGLKFSAVPEFWVSEVPKARIRAIMPIFIGVGAVDLDTSSKVKNKAGMFYGLGLGIQLKPINNVMLELSARRQWKHETHTFDLTEVEMQRNIGLISLTFVP